jgi:acetyl-CoA C-acetyltransferase
LAIREVVRRSKVSPENIDAVFLGHCNTTESKDIIAPVVARQALLKAGLPDHVISATIDKACCSGMDAIKRGYDAIRLQEAHIVIAGGVQSMSQTPHIVRGLRGGEKLAHFKLEDCLFPPGYKDYNPVAVDAGQVALEYGVGREEQDMWALTSQERYHTALQNGKFNEEIMSVQVKDGKGEWITLEKDEFPKPHTTLEKLRQLPTVYGNPTVTAGNAPGLNDGAAVVMLVGERTLNEMGLKPIAEIVTAVCIADKPKNIPVTPAKAIIKALDQANLSVDDIALFEINEAVAAVPLVSSKILGNNDEIKVKRIRDRLNVNGGAVAIGHPLGASGARIVLTLAYELRRLGGGYGVASICGGLGQGDAMLIKV